MELVIYLGSLFPVSDLVSQELAKLTTTITMSLVGQLHLSVSSVENVDCEL